MIYDLIIIGAGPAGLTASLYANRFNIKHCLIGKVLGGKIFNIKTIYNWPTDEEMDGKILAEKFLKPIRKSKTKIFKEEVIKVEIQNPPTLSRVHDEIGTKSKIQKIFKLKTASGKIFKTKTIILALGQEMGGICLLCEAPLIRVNKKVAKKIFKPKNFKPPIFLKNLGLKIDKSGFIKVNSSCQTNIAGIFAAGDITNFSNLKQVLTASASGAIASFSAVQYLIKYVPIFSNFSSPVRAKKNS